MQVVRIVRKRGSVGQPCGQVDGLEGPFVTGWAYTPDSERPANVVVIAPSGQVAGHGLANRRRPDLQALGLNRDNFAFRIAAAGLDGWHSLRVLVNGVELSGSPLILGPDIYDGHIAAVGDKIIGWVLERSWSVRGDVISIKDEVGDLVASAPILLENSPTDFRPTRFELLVPNDRMGERNLQLHGVIGEVSFAHCAATFEVFGRLEELSPSRCLGWIYCSAAPSRTLSLEVLRDGLVVGRGLANLPRLDVSELRAGAVTSGFDISVADEALRPVDVARVSVRLKDTRKDLFDGQYLVARKHALSAAARRGASLLRADPSLSSLDKHVLLESVRTKLSALRSGPEFTVIPVKEMLDGPPLQRKSPISVLVVVYRGAGRTREWFKALYAALQSCDRLVIVNDDAPLSEIAETCGAAPENVCLLNVNETVGLTGSINRALDVCSEGHVLLLSADTVLYPGSLDELVDVAESSSNIGTVTALSNNGYFSVYPPPGEVTQQFPDLAARDLAAAALLLNRGKVVDVPAGHWFCMLVTRQLFDLQPKLGDWLVNDRGSVNAYCSNAADLGFRNVVAGGVFVQHTPGGSASSAGRTELSIPAVIDWEKWFPEYPSVLLDFESRDPLRDIRLSIDEFRLNRLAETEGTSFLLTVEHALGGGTKRAVDDIRSVLGHGHLREIRLTIAGKSLDLSEVGLGISLSFGHHEGAELFRFLRGLPVSLIHVHQLLGLNDSAVRELNEWSRTVPMVTFVHDYYSLCPRVTMVDASGRFCNVGSDERCRRCVSLGGEHEASALHLDIKAHRALFADHMRSATKVVAPSGSAASYISKAFQNVDVSIIPHFEAHEREFRRAPIPTRGAQTVAVVLLGAIGPHKGSGRLLELAKLALLEVPNITFWVIGYTDIDSELQLLPNVVITGRYEKGQLENHVLRSGAELALFLHIWPETFSFTLSESVRLGLFPVVPDLGAPAERVRAAGFGAVYPLPYEPSKVLDTLRVHCEQRGANDNSGFIDHRDPGSVLSELCIGHVKSRRGTRASSTLRAFPSVAKTRAGQT